MLRSSEANVLPALGFTSICVTLSRLVLDRVLDGDDVLLKAVDLVQAGVEGGALAGAGRAAHDEHAVRLGDDVADLVAHLLAHAELRQAR